MSIESYLFEKACFVPAGLARLAEDAQLLPVGSPAEREVRAHLNVALRLSLTACCTVAGAEFDGSWVIDLAREGPSVWKASVKPALEEAMFGPDERDEALGRSGLPREYPPGVEPREVDVAALVPRATKTLAALLDLTDVVCKHGCDRVADGHFRSHLAWAFNGATKVLATLIDAEWDTGWPGELAEHGREAVGGVVATLKEAGGAWRFRAEDLAPLDEAWLVTMDPDRTPEAEQEAERRRRANVSKENRIPHDLVIPEHYRLARLEGLLVHRVPGHQVCADYARTPDGALVIHGELASGCSRSSGPSPATGSSTSFIRWEMSSGATWSRTT